MHLHKHGSKSSYGLGRIIAKLSWDEARSQEKCHTEKSIDKNIFGILKASHFTLRAPDKLKFFCRDHIS